MCPPHLFWLSLVTTLFKNVVGLLTIPDIPSTHLVSRRMSGFGGGRKKEKKESRYQMMTVQHKKIMSSSASEGLESASDAYSGDEGAPIGPGFNWGGGFISFVALPASETGAAAAPGLRALNLLARLLRVAVGVLRPLLAFRA